MRPEIGSTWKDRYGVVIVTENKPPYDNPNIISLTPIESTSTYYTFFDHFFRNFVPCKVCKTCGKGY